MSIRYSIPERGYAPLYHVGEEKQRCPCCHGLQWFIGRMSAECAKCGTALPLSTMGAEFMEVPSDA